MQFVLIKIKCNIVSCMGFDDDKFKILSSNRVDYGDVFGTVKKVPE